MRLPLLLPLFITVCVAEDACGTGPLNNHYIKKYEPCNQNAKDKTVYFCGGTGASIGVPLSNFLYFTIMYYTDVRSR